MPQEPTAYFTPPASDPFTSYAGADIGGAPAGGQAVPGPSDVTLYAGGLDIFGADDDMRFLSRSTSGNFFLSATLDSFDTGEGYAKAGLMIRASDDPRSAHLFVHALSDGRIMVTSRGSFGNGTSQRVVSVSSFPLGLAIGRQGSNLVAYVTDPDGQWQSVSISESVALPNSVLVGMAANAGDRDALEAAAFTNVTFTSGVSVPSAVPVPLSGNLLSNPSFETQGGASSLAASWVREGSLFNRETGWTPVRSGTCLMGYHHWETSGNASASISQSVSGLTPGQRYEFSVFVNRDPAGPGKALADRVELRIETTGSPALDHEIRAYDVEDLATGSGWSRVRVLFTAIASDARVRIVVYPDTSGAPRDSAVKFDQATLRAVP
jgi:regulation of enolase protein 1 (concanavalin A-like superfamily)